MNEVSESKDLVMCPACGHQWLGDPGDWFMGYDQDMAVSYRCPSCATSLIIEGHAEVTYHYKTTIREEYTDGSE